MDGHNFDIEEYDVERFNSGGSSANKLEKLPPV